MATASELQARRRQNEEELNFYSSNISIETLEVVRRRLAKRSNQRLVRLERSVSPVSGKSYHLGAYDMAQEYLKEQKDTDKANLRFSETLSQRSRKDFENDTEYRQYLLDEVAALQSFLTSKSSTVKGNRDIEQKRIKSFEKAGISKNVASSKGFYDFITSSAYKFLDARQISSDKLQDLYDYYTDPDSTRAISAEDFQRVADLYEDWLNEPANSKKTVKLKDLADRLDAFMIASDKYNTAELESRLVKDGVYTAKEIEDMKK